MDLSNENRLLILCARDGVSGKELEELSYLLSQQIKWDELLNNAISQGIAPLLYKRLKDVTEMVHIPEEIMGSLKTAYHSNVARNMYLYAELGTILRACDEKGIDVMTLKGAALAGTVYEDIGLRAMGDLDLLVKPECLPGIREIMYALNYEIQSHSKPEEWYRANHFHLPPFIHKEKSIVVEIHWKVAQDPLGIDVSNWWGRARKISLRETSFLIPAPEDMVLHLCVSMYHNNYSKAALRGLSDIIHTIRCFSVDTNWGLLRKAISRSEIAKPVYSLLFLVRKYFNDNDQLLSWIEQGPVDAKFSAMLERIMFAQEGDSSAVFIRSLGADTKWGKSKNIISHLFPSQEEMSERYPIQPGSVKVYFYYAYRPFELAVKYGRSFLKTLGFRDSG